MILNINLNITNNLNSNIKFVNLFYYMRFILFILCIVTLKSRELCISLKRL